ncbi:hypothetical protein VPHD382_0171 [Vibrio phage D382]
MIYNFGEAANHLQTLQDGEYLLMVADRSKTPGKKHDLYSKVGNKEMIFDALCEIDVLSRYAWSQNPDLVPVVYLSNVHVNQQAGYEELLRTEAAKLLQGQDIKARLLSTNKPAYMGMARDWITYDIDSKSRVVSRLYRDEHGDTCEKIVDMKELLVTFANDMKSLGFGARLTETCNGFHISVSKNGVRFIEDCLNKFSNAHAHVDKKGKDVLSPMPGSTQRGFEVKRLV